MDRQEDSPKKTPPSKHTPRRRDLTEAERRRGRRIAKQIIDICSSAKFIEARPASMLASDLAIAAVLLVSGHAEGWLPDDDFLDLTYRTWCLLFFDDGSNEDAKSPNVGALVRRHERETRLMPSYLEYAHDVAEMLTSLEPAAEVRIVELPGLDDDEDIEQFVAQREGVTTEDIRAEIAELAVRATLYAPIGSNGPPDGELVSRLASTITAEPVQWLLPGLLVAGAINVFVGMPDVGKSVLTCDIAARITRAMPWPFDDNSTPIEGSVAFVALEDSPKTTIVPRLEAAGADLNRVHIIDGVARFDAGGQYSIDALDIGRDIERLRRFHQTAPNLKLVIIDPLDSALGETDPINSVKVRRALWPLKEWCEESGVTAILVCHFNKKEGQLALDRISGSRAFGSLPRLVWAVAYDEASSLTVVAPIKLNLVSKAERKAISFELKSSTDDPAQPVVAWRHEAVNLTADELIGAHRQPSRTEQTVEFLKEILADGPLMAEEVRVLCEKADVSSATASKKDVKERAGVESRPVRENGKVVGWQWRKIDRRAREGDLVDVVDVDDLALEAENPDRLDRQHLPPKVPGDVAPSQNGKLLQSSHLQHGGNIW